MRFVIPQFPGSNCERDAYYVLQTLCGQEVALVWHRETQLPRCDAVIIPGGFSYGDYLRSGAMAAQSPIMAAVKHFAAQGGLVLGICNGFQILTEAGLLPGALLRNAGLRFECCTVHLRIERTDTPFTSAYAARGALPVLAMPMAHHDGNYCVDADTQRQLQRHCQIVFRYCAPNGRDDPEANPNGSVGAIAGVCNIRGNVMGLMPHPERCAESLLGGEDGLGIFQSMMAARRGGAA